jgi:tetratricopeptide (TPR) repeat protein
MVKTTLDYLHTRPVTTTIERTTIRTPTVLEKKKSQQTRVMLHERDRRFLVVPDLLAAPGAINLRVVADDYYAVVPAGTDPNSSEVRRAYLRYVVDPLVLRFNRDIALKRADVQSILDARAKASNATMPAVFEAVARSLVVAVDARMTAQTKLNELSARATTRAATAKDAERAALTKEVQEERARIDDEMTTQLADAYEHGAALAFYFSEQLREQESSGFDFADAFTDVISRVDPAREIARPAEYAAARARVAAAREKEAKEAARRAPADEHEASRRAELISQLDEVSRMLQARKYPEAEVRLRALLDEYKGEPRVFFALGQTWSVGAEDAANEETRDTRLNNALANYANAIQMADRDNDLALISRAHVARGRILSFLERRDEALQEFDAAIKIGEAGGDAYKEALKEKQKLQP